MGTAYVFLCFLSFYCCCYRLPVGVKYAVNVLVTGWAVLAFLVKPRMEDAKYCLRFVLLFSVTFLIPWVWSVLIWIGRVKTMDYIVRGSLNIFYMLTGVLFVGASYYLFGERAIPYMLIGMALANGLVYLQVGAANGMGVLLSQHVELILTFAGRTGAVVRKMELHDVVFGWGVFLIYYAFRRTKKPWQRWAYLLISAFFFTAGFKRIGVMAVILALAVAFMLNKLSERGKKTAVRAIFITFTALAFGYIIMVRTGLFYQIAQAMKVNLMGRKAIYSAYDDFYELSPFFLGQGTRFVYQYGITVNGVEALHNDLLGLYIEVGFGVWFLWMWYEFSFRAHYIGQRFSYQAAVNLVACSIYVYITFMTDNTFYYYPINVIYRLTAMAWCYQAQRPKNAEEKGGNFLANPDYQKLPHHV